MCAALHQAATAVYDSTQHSMSLLPSHRRYTEKTIGYAESHDQALVGDQTVGEHE